MSYKKFFQSEISKLMFAIVFSLTSISVFALDAGGDGRFTDANKSGAKSSMDKQKPDRITNMVWTN